MRKNFALIGPRGVGKSKISRKLSKITEMPVVSTDMIAVYEMGGISIPEFIQENEGDWRTFRDLEFQILVKLKTSRGIILDCGGGILFDLDAKGKEIPSNRKIDLLKSIAVVFGLSKPTDALVEKIQSDPTRPPLSAINSYRNVLENRLPHYRSVSDYYLEIDDLKVEEVCSRILRKIEY
ncbi:shikimate kinase [Leptospira mayottensis]|uniref:Shikimate kinase n=2 Tax=Leptospira mayottensis TaxID=1137606 RepID=A0AA87SWP2_9LEPT|nr:shikimate kinase [Leptospira mayottensis]AXR62644.1 shikimate kinase [Leptospira mayottensis]AXR66461.1 shikimate kinase [Leptospira mayottensis]AZQ04027.1 shikimate kinase [Leptospira mayottensis 200901116]EKS00065.1 shikimate kinase [Leptospira mayottensis 200901122]TGM89695.1 shikimate kinase [Leptospira mayottensis]